MFLVSGIWGGTYILCPRGDLNNPCPRIANPPTPCVIGSTPYRNPNVLGQDLICGVAAV